MSADTATDGTVGDVGASGHPAAGTRVYSSWRSDRIDVDRDGRWSCVIGVTYGTVELIGDRPLVRHGATYEDLGERWYTSEEAARAAQADTLCEMAAGLLDQAKRLREAQKSPPGGDVPASR